METFIFNGKTYSTIPKELKFFNKCLALELLFTIKINGTGTIEKLWCFGKNYSAMEKTMELLFTIQTIVYLHVSIFCEGC